MSRKIQLTQEESVQSPTLIPNPQSPIDARMLKEVYTRYGLDYLEGVLVNIEDWTDLQEILFEDRTVQSRLQRDEFGKANDTEYGSIESEPLIIYPDMAPLLGYSYSGEADSILSLELEQNEPVIAGDLDLSVTLEQVSNATDKGKRRLRNQVLSPFLAQRQIIQNILEFQVQEGATVALTPSVPITSMRDFSDRIDIIDDIFRISSAIVEGGLLSKEIDLMRVFSIDPTVLRRPEDGVSTRKDELIALLENHNPEKIGVHLQNLNHEHQDRIQTLLNVISEISQRAGVPIFLFNVDEFGLSSFANGVDVISGPIASFPYERYSNGNSTASRGKYYHYEDLFGYSREWIMEITRPEYRFPCYCEICEHFERVPAVDTDNWNEFRRIHYLLVKDKEIKRIQDTDKILREALRDMLANSRRTDLTPYL